MIKYKTSPIKQKLGLYHTKLTYYIDKPGYGETEMIANICGATKEEVELKVRQFIADQEK